MEKSVRVSPFNHPRRGVFQQEIEFGKRSGRDRIANVDFRVRVLDSNGVDAASRARFAQHGSQERRFLMVALDEMNPSVPQFRKKNGCDDAGKAAATAKIHPYLRFGGDLKYLCTVRDVPTPQIIQSRRRNQIDRFGPFLKETGKKLQSFLCFT
jgi:hypothetical protein